MGPNDVVRNILINDTSAGSRTAASLSADFPEQFPNPADVDRFLYTPLWKLLLPTSTNPNDLKDYVYASLGKGEGDAERGIYILTLPAESVEKPEGMTSDAPGAEFAILKIHVRLHATVAANESDVVEQCDRRIRWLIDSIIRKKRKDYDEPSLKMALPIPSGQTSIDRKVPFLVSYRGFLEANNVTEIASMYHAQYGRVFV